MATVELIIAAVVAGVAVAALLTWVIWRSSGAAIDWLIATFGNEGAIRRLRASKDARRGAHSRRGPR